MNLNKTIKKINLCITLIICVLSSYAQKTISGNVTDETGNLIESADIIILGTVKGVSTNAKGEYRITNLSNKSYFIKANYLGFASQTTKIDLEEDNTILNFVLKKSTNELEEVIISGANNRLENIQTTAASISAISSKEIAQLQISQISELNSISPNFRAYDDGANGAFTMISSRGITTYDNKPVVGVYIDDIPYFNGYSFPIALQDIDNIELLRGPQGTLYGRNSLAGVVRITTKKPTNTINGYIKAGYGNLEAKELALTFNAPLVEDKLFFRASTNIIDRNGFINNSFNNKELQNRKNIDANFKLKYLATDRLRLGFLYNVQRKESDAYAFLISSSQNALQDLLKDPYKVNFDVDVFRKTVNQNIAFNIKYDFSGFNINSISAYQTTVEDGADDYDYTPLDIQSSSGLSKVKNFSQEFRFVSNGDSNLKWVGGLLLYHNMFQLDRNLNTGNDIGQINPTLEPLAPFTRLDDSKNTQKGIAVYGQASYDIIDKLILTGGVRFDYEESSLDIKRTFNTSAFLPGSFEKTAEFNAFSPKLSLSYTANDDVFVFASIAKGFRPGGINEFVLDKQKATFDNESSINYEIGVKTNFWDNRIKLNLTGFYTSYTDQQIYTIVDLSAFAFGNDNIGESRIFGAELEAKASLAKGLTLGLNLGYLNAEIKKYEETVINPQDGSTTLVDRSGKSLPVSPEINGNITLNYIQPITKKIDFETSLDYNYQDDIYFDIPNQMLQKAYGLLNGKVGITSKNIDVFVWAKNLTDEAYFSYGYGVGGFQASTFALPRTYGTTLTFKF
ncbi:iron complex outermembrane receptor protein [Aquimarina sp. MAR_2010_214]|uniref:TonB-dependent receptor n=1 Tax=Aquimarina sp. MAR_2010_214 TaxID=1250026 RepID=UPI000C70B94E|nr:TonB-dependent receptor [Aquimarina sp. MAR_2010_214]PKV49232.1 iron complex outermembrane receptor protein [Aquimarina sp. MAR_2010_214]